MNGAYEISQETSRITSKEDLTSNPTEGNKGNKNIL